MPCNASYTRFIFGKFFIWTTIWYALLFAQKNLFLQKVGVTQLAPRDVPPQQEPQHDSPREEEPFEIVVVAPKRQEPQGAPVEEPQLPQNNEHDNDHREEENNEKEEERATRLKVKMMKNILLGATPRRTRRSTMPTRSKLLQMKPRSPLADWGICWTASTSPLHQSSESREFCALAEKSIRKSWRSSTDPMCPVDPRDQPSGPLVKMQ
jgi:hypothetical protein